MQTICFINIHDLTSQLLLLFAVLFYLHLSRSVTRSAHAADIVSHKVHEYAIKVSQCDLQVESNAFDQVKYAANFGAGLGIGQKHTQIFR